MSHQYNHDYKILPPSLWPVLGSLFAFLLMFGTVLFLHDVTPFVLGIGVLGVLYTMFGWWSDMIKEANSEPYKPVVQIAVRYGFILFIISEVAFFFAWFWSFFKHALYPMTEGAGGVWPPVGIETFDPWHIPLINTLILLSSGAAITWAHHALVHENNRNDMKWGLIIGIALGVVFTFFQIYEYSHAAFSFAGNIYGANFFMATGFHGAHVIIGTLFLLVCLFRLLKGDFTPQHHLGFEAAAWYWHFVDVIWLFLFAAIYVWGG